jgi:DNA primase
LEVVERLGLGPTRKVGREYLVCCPLHADADPSLRLDAAKGLWYCDPCGEGGDGIRLVMAVRGVSFPDAVRALVS